MDLLSLIIIISVIVKIFKKNSPDKYEDVKRKAKELGGEVYGGLRGNVNARRSDYEKKIKEYEQSARQHKPAQQYRANTYEMPKQNVRTTPAREQVTTARMEAQNTTILQRAKTNTEADKDDVTLRSLEESHGHSARVTPAVHNHPEDEISENMLGKVEDLMVKGYEGNLCFERDFVGEAMDMVNKFSVGGSV